MGDRVEKSDSMDRPHKIGPEGRMDLRQGSAAEARGGEGLNPLEAGLGGRRYYEILDLVSQELDVWFDDQSDLEMPLYYVFCALCAAAQ